MAVIAFQVFIKHTAVIDRRILKYAHMSSKAVEGMSFSDCKNVFFFSLPLTLKIFINFSFAYI
jgi:hypothetical protein